MLDIHARKNLLAEPPQNLAGKISATVGRGKIAAEVVARACGVTVQAVNGWKRNGRIDKRHIKTLSELTGLPVAWWLPGFDGNDDVSELDWPFSKWIPYSRVSSLDEPDLGYLAGILKSALDELDQSKKSQSHPGGSAA